MDRKVGDYDWVQISMWDFPPHPSILRMTQSLDGRNIYEFYLVRTVEVLSMKHSRFEVVAEADGIPSNMFDCDRSQYYSYQNHRRTLLPQNNQ